MRCLPVFRPTPRTAKATLCLCLDGRVVEDVSPSVSWSSAFEALLHFYFLTSVQLEYILKARRSFLCVGVPELDSWT